MADLSITAASVLKSASGTQSIGTIAAATTVTAGKALYQLANGTYGLADSNGSSPANTFAGIALTGGGAGQPVLFCGADAGGFTLGATVTVGATIYLSNTAGGLTETYADVASSSTVIAVGVAVTASTINLTPVVGGVKP